MSELRRRLGDTLTALTGVMPWSRQSLNAILVITASVLVSALISLVLPVATAWLYGTIIPQHAPDLLPWLFLTLVAVAVASAASEYLRGRLMLQLLLDWDYRIHARVFERLLHARLDYLRGNSNGDWAARLLALTEARRAIGPVVLNAMFGLAAGIANLLYMLSVQTQLALAALLPTLALAWLTALLSRRRIDADRALLHWEGRLVGFSASVLENLPALQQAGALTRAGERQQELFTGVQNAHGRGQRAGDLLMTLQAGFALAAPLLLFAAVGLLVRGIETSEFLAFYAAFGQMLFAVLGVVSALTQLLSAAAPLQRIVPLLQAPQESGGPVADDYFLGLTLEQIVFRYQSDAPAALDGVGLQLRPGEIVALTGASGSGKTTILKLILALEQAQSGVIRINDQELQHWQLAALRRLLGVALPNSPLISGTVADNITGLLPASAISERAVAALTELLGLTAASADLPQGIATLLSEPAALPESLRHRLLLARALINRPGLLLLDEVTNTLAPDVQQRLLAHIRSIGAAGLIITHNRLVMAAADRVLLLERGKITAQGKYAELMAEDGAFARFFTAI